MMNVDLLIKAVNRRLDDMEAALLSVDRPDGGPRGVWIEALSPLSDTLEWDGLGEESLADAELMAHMMAEEAYEKAMIEQWELRQNWDEAREDRRLGF